MEFEDIREKVSSAQASTSASRDEASEMLVFGRITQWGGEYADATQLQYRGQFDLIKPKRNKIVAELHSNPTTVTFKSRDGASEEGAETLNGMFKSDMIYGEEALETAQQDMVDCGYGAFRFVTQYENKFDDLNNYQVIRPEPINEANNTVYWDDNARKKDKSDAMWCLIVTPFTKSGYQSFCKENGISYDDHANDGSFTKPNTDHAYFLRNTTKHIDIGEFYHKERKRKRVLIFEDPMGIRQAVYESDIKNKIDELDELGFVKIGQKYKDRWVITKYLVSGTGILKKSVIAGEYIPVVPMYGDWSYVEKREIWRGIYHDAQDQQRMYNTSMSYLMDIFGTGPREKPIFYPEQIQGYEYMYHMGADNNYPYLLQNHYDQEGNELPGGPVNYVQNPQVPPTTAAIIEQMKSSINDVTGGSMSTADMLNSQVTEGQLSAVNASQNMETFLYRNSYQLAMKQAGRIYASMAAELYDVPREVTVTNPDGSEKLVMVNESILDMETGEETLINDISSGRFDVYADTGPSYHSQREEQANKMAQLYQSMPDTEEGRIALLSWMTVQEGPGFDVMRKHAHKALLLGGYIEPETQEDEQIVMQAQQAAQNQQPDANTMFAMAEQQKAANEAEKNQIDAQLKAGELAVKEFKAESERIKVMSDANMNQVDATKTATEIRGNELDNVSKLAQALIPQTMLQ